MKMLGFSALALLAGFLLGGWSPRSDLYDLEEKVLRLQQKLDDRADNGNPSLSGITRMLNVPEHGEEMPLEVTVDCFADGMMTGPVAVLSPEQALEPLVERVTLGKF